MRKALALPCLLFAATGCTYSTQTSTLASAAAEVRPDQHISAPLILRFDAQYDSLTKDAVKNSYECSAHRYPSTVGPAIKQSVVKAFEAVFDSVDVTGNASSNPAAVVINVRHEAYNPAVSFASGFWSGKASAQSEIVMRISAERNSRQIMYPVVVSGQGSSMGVSGGCGKIAMALDQANKAALQRLMENLAYRVINNGDLKRAVSGTNN